MKRLFAVLVLGCVGAVGYSAPAGAADVPFIDWNPLLPGLPSPYHPSREKDCIDGSNECVEGTLTEMYRRFDNEYATCDHNAAFGITYIRVTEGIRKAVHDGLFQEPTYLNHEDKVFARMYFNSYDAWKRGDRAAVPAAWKIALDAGRDKTNAGIGDLLMSMNAHIERDMPFMLDAMGLTRPDGSNRKLDHDKGNRVLSPLFDDVLEELGKRFDVTTARFNLPGLPGTTLIQVLQIMREQVWRNAELLGISQTLGAKKAIAAEIEGFAATFGTLIHDATLITPGQAKLRDAHCADYRRAHPDTGGLLQASAPKKGLAATKGAVRLRVACPPLRNCTGTVKLTRRGKPVSASRRVTLKGGESGVVRLPITRSARSAMKKHKSLPVRAATASPSPWGSTRTTSALTRLRR